MGRAFSRAEQIGNSFRFGGWAKNETVSFLKAGAKNRRYAAHAARAVLTLRSGFVVHSLE